MTQNGNNDDDPDSRLLALLLVLALHDRPAYRTLRKAAWEHVVDRVERGDISLNTKKLN